MALTLLIGVNGTNKLEWMQISELSEVQRIRALDAIEYQGQVANRVF